MHLLSGAVEMESVAPASEVRPGAPALAARVEALEDLVRTLEERLKVLEDCGVFSQEPEA